MIKVITTREDKLLNTCLNILEAEGITALPTPEPCRNAKVWNGTRNGDNMSIILHSTGNKKGYFVFVRQNPRENLIQSFPTAEFIY